jgi:hypothetical protein
MQELFLAMAGLWVLGQCLSPHPALSPRRGFAHGAPRTCRRFCSHPARLSVFPLLGERVSLPIIALAKLGVREKEVFTRQGYLHEQYAAKTRQIQHPSLTLPGVAYPAFRFAFCSGWR